MRRKNIQTLLLFALLASISALFCAGCGDLEGTVNKNQAPIVEFVTVPQDSSTFSYAPVIYWKGSDPDGFVEYYSFADVTDEAAFASPKTYHEQLPDEAWTDVVRTEQRIYLLTPSGEDQQHIFYIRCYDNKGQVSDVEHRVFYRSNQAPRVPEIGMVGASNDEMGNNVYIADTLFSGNDITTTWGGITFTWRGSDPDDRALYKIPLEFKPILVKAPGDTIFEYPWSADVGTVLSGLETGFYTLNVWARDDGFTLSTSPARIEFNVIKPTFEHSVLMVVEELASPAFPPASEFVDFYGNMLTDVFGEAAVADTVNIRKMLVNSATDRQQWLSSSIINQYKMVIIAADQYYRTPGGLDGDYLDNRNKLLVNYLSVGGRLWYQGRFLGFSVMDTTNNPDVYADGATLISDFLMADSLVGRGSWVQNNIAFADLVDTRPALNDFVACEFDTNKASLNVPGGGYLPNNYGQSGAEVIARRGLAETTQYFISMTADLEADTTNEDSEVLSIVVLNEGTFFENEFHYPPTPTDCYLKTVHKKVNPNDVSRVVNVTHREQGLDNYIGTPIIVNDNIVKISYEEGDPWEDDDLLEVDYSYDPLTKFHLKPVEIRFERVENVNMSFSQLRFRTALTSYSYYYVDYQSALHNWRSMIDWFFNPDINR